MSKEVVLTYIHELLSYNIIGDKQYVHRYDGFNGELDFEVLCRSKGWKVLQGGLFIPLADTSNPFENSIYILACPFSFDQEKEVFITHQLRCAAAIATRGVFLVRYDVNEPVNTWSALTVPSGNGDISVPFPASMRIFSYAPQYRTLEHIDVETFCMKTGLRSYFRRKAAIPDVVRDKYIGKLSCYSESDITGLYMSRFVLDALCSQFGYAGKIQRGAPLDVDLFLRGKKQWVVIEVKEKNLSRNGCFGMDTRRITSLNTLKSIFSTEAHYVVRQVADQKKRDFVAWKKISMSDFEYHAPLHEVQGGFGMRGENTDNPTRLCEEKYFHSLT